MYSVGRHSRRSSSSRNRTGKPYAAHLARLDYLLIYLPTQVQSTLTKIIKIVATRWRILSLKCTKFDFGAGGAYSLQLEMGVLLLRGGKRRGDEGNGSAMSPPPSIWRKFTPMSLVRWYMSVAGSFIWVTDKLKKVLILQLHLLFHYRGFPHDLGFNREQCFCHFLLG